MLTIAIASAYNFVNPVPLTRAALRKAISGITVTLSGSVGNSDLSAGAVTPAKVTPGAYWHDHAASYDSGTSTYSVTLSPVLGALGSGVVVSFKAGTTCGAGANVSVSSLATKAILRQDGSALQPGDIRAGQIVELRYDAAAASGSGAWLLVSAPSRPLSNVLTLGGTVSGGLCTAFTVTPVVQPATLAEAAGQIYTFKAHATNAASATLALGTLAAKGIVSHGGVAVKEARWIADEYIVVAYDATLDKWVVLSRPGDNYYAGEDAGSTDAYALTLPGFPQTPVKGMTVSFKPHTVNTGACTLAINGGSAINIVRDRGQAPFTAQLIADHWVQVVYDGTNWQLVGVDATTAWVESSEYGVQSSAYAMASISHGLGGILRRIRAVFVVKKVGGLFGYAEGDEIDVLNTRTSTGGNYGPAIVVYANSTVLYVKQFTDMANIRIPHATTPETYGTPTVAADLAVKVYYGL